MRSGIYVNGVGVKLALLFIESFLYDNVDTGYRTEQKCNLIRLIDELYKTGLYISNRNSLKQITQFDAYTNIDPAQFDEAEFIRSVSMNSFRS